MRYLVALALIIGVLAGSSAATANPATPVASVALFPSPDKLGSGWTSVETTKPTGYDQTIFSDISTALYVGPKGARISIAVYTIQSGRVANQNAWTIANGDRDRWKSSYGIYSTANQREIDQLPLPANCLDITRAQGADPVFGLPVGFTLCAADPNLIVSIVVSGEVAGLSGAQAANNVMLFLLNQ